MKTCLALAAPLLLAAVDAYSKADIQLDAPYYRFEAKHKAQINADNARVAETLAAHKKKHGGQPPNLIFVLSDDVGWNELGSYMGGEILGAKTPVLDSLATDGIQFYSAYSEPSCTPSRVAIMTGRKPPRTGLTNVIFPGNKNGLHPDEVTLAEVLSDAGYATAMYGKWHLGDEEEHAPENQGFDEALYGLYNGAPFLWHESKEIFSADKETVPGTTFIGDYPGNEKYLEEEGIKVWGMMRGEKGKGRKEVIPLTSSKVMEDIEEESIVGIKKFIKKNVAAKKPFFVYWATYFQQGASSPQKYRHQEGVDYHNNHHVQRNQHEDHMSQLLDTLKEQGVDENTLLVWHSDNGPMYNFWPMGGYSYLKGGKGEVTEGGVRVPAFARWPSMIKPGQKLHDIVSLNDWFLIFANVAGALEHVPRDRVYDAIDQTALILDGQSHRDFVFHYSGKSLLAVRKNDHKCVINPGNWVGNKNVDLFNLKRDIAEKFPQKTFYLPFLEPFTQMFQAHVMRKKAYPDRVVPPSVPTAYEGLEFLFAAQEDAQDCASSE